MSCCWRGSRRLANKHVLTGGANLGEFRLNCARYYWSRCCNLAIPPTVWNCVKLGRWRTGKLAINLPKRLRLYPTSDQSASDLAHESHSHPSVQYA